MLTDFPIPYEDETLYSLIARYHRHSGNLFQRYSIESLFGKKENNSSSFIPIKLGTLADNLRSFGITFETLLLQHSLFPFYLLFDTKENNDMIWNWAKNNNDKSITYLCGKYKNNKEYLMFCPECLKEELEQLGEAYWHRMHQTPGTITCLKHKCRLQKTNIKMNSTWNKGYEVLKESLIFPYVYQENYTKSINYHANQMNRDISFLYQNYSKIQNDLWSNTNDLYKQYLYFAKRRGYLTEHNRLRQKVLIDDFIHFFGQEYLEVINEIPTQNKPWIVKLFQSRKSVASALRYILAAQFLAGNLENFLNCNDYVNLNREHISRKLPENFETKLEYYRKRYDNAYARNKEKSRSSVRKLDDASYQWLMRHDKEWIEAHFGEELRKGGNKTYPVDWEKIDLLLSHEVLKIVLNEFSGNRKPERLTKSLFYREVKGYHITEKNITKCPVTERTIKACLEVTTNYQLRRLVYWKIELANQGIYTEWILFKKAGIKSKDIYKMRRLLEREETTKENRVVV